MLRLRKLLSRHALGSGPGGGIETSPGGYRIIVDERSLDLLAFRNLAAGASSLSSLTLELQALRRALSFWEGDPVLNLASPALRSGVVASLIEERIRILVRCHEIELSLGNHSAVVPELRQLSNEFPDNERLSAQLMESLYRTGRQGEALSAYQQISGHLRETFGIDPGPELQQLHLSIVRGEDLAGGRYASAPAPLAEWVDAGEAARTELPARLGDFLGRTCETDEIESIIGRKGGRVLVLCGLPGVGKTALAVHVAHRLRSRFPGGVHFVQAGGSAALSGISTQRESLVVLDDVRHIDQVRPVVDSGGSGAVIITSRRSLADIVLRHGAALYRIGSWRRTDSVSFLTSTLGSERASSGGAHLEQLAETCDDHPMALRLAAMRISLRPQQNVSEAMRGRPAAGYPGDPLASAFEDYLSSLTPVARTALRSISAAGSETLSGRESADVLQESDDRVSALLDELVESCAVEHIAGGRYRIPRILRDHVNQFSGRPSP